MANKNDRQKRILEHLARSNGNFTQKSTSVTSDQRKQQIMDHVRRTLG